MIRRRLDYVSGETSKAKEELEKNIQKVQEMRSAALDSMKAKEVCSKDQSLEARLATSLPHHRSFFRIDIVA